MDNEKTKIDKKNIVPNLTFCLWGQEITETCVIGVLEELIEPLLGKKISSGFQENIKHCCTIMQMCSTLIPRSCLWIPNQSDGTDILVILVWHWRLIASIFSEASSWAIVASISRNFFHFIPRNWNMHPRYFQENLQSLFAQQIAQRMHRLSFVMLHWSWFM